MTQLDTHKKRLDLWPRLSTFPSTNGMIVLVMALWAATGFCALLFAFLEHGEAHAQGAHPLAVPERWYQALEVFTGIVVVQFIGKRASDSQLWRRTPRKPKPKEATSASG